MVLGDSWLISAAKIYIFFLEKKKKRLGTDGHRYPARVEQCFHRRQKFIMKISVPGMRFLPTNYWSGKLQRPQKCYFI